MDKRIRTVNILCVLLLLIFAVGVFRINHFSRLFSDDYLYSFRFNPGFTHADPATLQYEKIAGIDDFLASQAALYQNLTGRIVPHALLQIFLLLPPPVFDILNTLAFFALTLLMSTWILGGRRRLILPWWLLTSILFYLAVFSTIPNLYLPAFSCNYLWTALIVFILLIPVRRHLIDNAPLPKSYAFALLMLILGIIAGDTNEPVVPALLLAMGVLGLWMLIRERRLPLWYISAGLGLALGFAFLYFAPGNTQRALYEAENAGKQGIGFSLSNLKPIIFSTLTAFPAMLIGILGLIGLRRKPDPGSVPAFVFMLLMLSGCVFALLFSPLYMARMNILFVGYLILLPLLVFRAGRWHNVLWLSAFILFLAPFAALKVSSDLHRMSRADREYALFRQELGACDADSCLVTPRAYLDPLTRENWAKPMAEYYGKKYLWVQDELSPDNTADWKPVSYSQPSVYAADGITLKGLRYIDHNAYSRTVYVLLTPSDPAFDPAAISLNIYSADIASPWLRGIYERLPQRARDFLLREEPTYRPPRYIEIDGAYVYPLPMRVEDWRDDYLRLRITSGNAPVRDIRLRDVNYLR